MDYSSAASFSSHSQIVSGRKKAIWLSSCLASAAHSDSEACLNTVMYIPYSVIYKRDRHHILYKSTETEQTHAHPSSSALLLFQYVIHQFTATTIIPSIGVSNVYVQVELFDCYQLSVAE